MTTTEEILENAWENRDSLTKENASREGRESVAEAIDLLVRLEGLEASLEARASRRAS